MVNHRLSTTVTANGYNGDSYYCSPDYGFLPFQDSLGFLVFTYGTSPVDYYSDDVVYGTLYTTEQHLEDGSEGIIIFDSSVLGEIGFVFYDPVVY